MANPSAYKEVLLKAQKYCAYQERSCQDVRNRMLRWQVDKSLFEKVIQALKAEAFLDEKRYAISYARGKTNGNKWGKQKIRYELINKNIPSQHIEHALSQIDETLILANLKHLAQKHWPKIKGETDYIKKQKLAAYLVAKGYEGPMAFETIKELNLS